MSLYKYDPALDDYVEKDLDELQAEQMPSVPFPDYTEEDYYKSLGEEAYQEWLNHINEGEK